jgi:hypothetical protein
LYCWRCPQSGEKDYGWKVSLRIANNPSSIMLENRNYVKMK